MWVSMLTAAPSEVTSLDPLSLVGTVITPVLIVILLLTGKIHTDQEYKRQEAERLKDQAEIARLHEIVAVKDAQLTSVQEAIVEKAIPALVRSTLVQETLSALLQTEVSFRKPRATGGEG